MFEQAVHASEALQEAARNTSRPLVPALSGCKACQTVHMSASPVLGRCIDCGDEGTCEIRHVFARVTLATREVLDHTSLADALAGSPIPELT